MNATTTNSTANSAKSQGNSSDCLWVTPLMNGLGAQITSYSQGNRCLRKDSNHE